VDQESEIDELRRRAYSRAGTDDDRRRLAELESSTTELRRLPSWIAAGAGALVGAALATAVTLVAVAPSTPEAEAVEATALSVFERAALTIDDPDNLASSLHDIFRDAEGSMLESVDDVTLRWVGVAEGNEVYAARWDQGESVAICLIVESSDQANVACTPEADFVDRGIRMSVAGIQMKWGPSDTDVWVTTFR
jgi:hypothetical protein